MDRPQGSGKLVSQDADPSDDLPVNSEDLSSGDDQVGMSDSPIVDSVDFASSAVSGTVGLTRQHSENFRPLSVFPQIVISRKHEQRAVWPIGTFRYVIGWRRIRIVSEVSAPVSGISGAFRRSEVSGNPEEATTARSVVPETRQFPGFSDSVFSERVRETASSEGSGVRQSSVSHSAISGNAPREDLSGGFRRPTVPSFAGFRQPPVPGRVRFPVSTDTRSQIPISGPSFADVGQVPDRQQAGGAW